MSLLRERLFLVDTFGLIFRAYYGRARAQVPGLRTASGLPTEAVYVFNNMLQKLLQDHEPDYLAAVWEGSGPTFREGIYPEYKANREQMPEDLAVQLPYIKELLECWNVQVLAEDGFEADDTIGSLAAQASKGAVDVWVVSSDKDLMQLVRDGVTMYNPMKDETYGPADVEEFLGVKPANVTDFLALKGDSVDNIPGAPGIGDKGAQQLIAAYGDIEGIIERAPDVKRKTYRESLENHADQIRLSKRLASLDTSGSLALDLESVRRTEADSERLLDLYRRLEFRSLASRLESGSDVEPDVALRVFESGEQFDEWLASATGPIAVAAPASGEAEGIGLSADAEESWMLPTGLASHAKALIEGGEREIWVHDWKSAIHSFRAMGWSFPRASDDTMLMAFLNDSSRTNYSLQKTVERRLGSTWKDDPAFAASRTRALRETLRPGLAGDGLEDVYEAIELPLAPVLARMEAAGVRLEPAVLSALSARLEEHIRTLSQEIHSLAGEEFNINSPQQLSKILYERLGLTAPRKRGKTKSLSTSSDILDAIASEHPIVSKVLEWRHDSKLKSTYVDALPKLVDADGRLHTTFNPTGSATGRLSSLNPNLQNVPTRTEAGKEIRRAFVPDDGAELVALDYSQIELRLLAHMSEDPKLLGAFQRGEDIHTITASEVLGIPTALIGPEERHRAKAVNFGIIYGLSAFGLSQQLGIPQRSARDYIELYFERYGVVKEFLARTVAETAETGYSRTLFGRRRPIPDLGSKNPSARAMAERIAVNSPIQGSAADLIKKAMVVADAALSREGFRSRIILQIHDELILEAPSDEVEPVAACVKEAMETAGQLAVPLQVDVKVGPNWADLQAR